MDFVPLSCNFILPIFSTYIVNLRKQLTTELGMLANTFNVSSQEAESCRTQVQSQPILHGEFQDNLRPYLRNAQPK